MKVQIDEIIHGNSNIVVAFSSSFGSAKAYWDGDEPIAKSEYLVEVDVDNTLVWNKDILQHENNAYSIRLKNDFILISGYIDSIDEDGYTVLRIGDNIIPFLTTGAPFPIGTNVTLSTKTITLSPFSY
jgi:hypothetical protein